MWHVSSRSGVATLRTAIHLLLTCYSLGRTGFATPHLTVFGKMGCQNALCLGESFHLEGSADVVGIDKRVDWYIG